MRVDKLLASFYGVLARAREWPHAERARRSLRALRMSRPSLAFVLVLALSSCRREPPTVVLPDAGPLPDAPIPLPMADTDGDGLCDTTEAALGWSFTSTDTDGDGYGDAVEYAAGYDGRRINSPDPGYVVFLTEMPDARVEVSIRLSATGEGQSFVGSFNDYIGVLRDPDLLASSYLVDAHAIGALPSDAIIGVEGERFLGLRDRALLLSSVTFENVSLPEDCARAFGFQYVMKDDIDGRIVGVHTGLLVVTPPGLVASGDTWCRVLPDDVCF
jgi:hypothetical protein